MINRAKTFARTVGLSEDQVKGVRKDVESSPCFLVDDHKNEVDYENVSHIARTRDGRLLHQRCVSKGLWRYEIDGRVVSEEEFDEAIWDQV